MRPRRMIVLVDEGRTEVKPMSSDRIVVYDEHCRLCSRWVRYFSRHPVEPPFQLLPMQGEAGRRLMLEHGVDPVDPLTFLVVDGERVLTASDATLHLLAVVGGVRRAFRLLSLVPRAWRDCAYRVVARNRYRWFGRHQRCGLPEKLS